MDERILVISDKKGDGELFEKILGSKGFDIEVMCLSDGIEVAILKDTYAAVLADYDLIGDRVYDWLGFFQESVSRACFILYGEAIEPDNVAELLQKGAFGLVPRALLSERIYDTVLGGLENRKALVDILGMVDALRDINETLEKEKDALRKKNQELGFINRLSSKVAYALNWDRILPRIMDAGLLKVIDPEMFSILYRIGNRWKLALHLSGKEINKETLERLKEDVAVRFLTLSGKKISTKDMDLHLYPANIRVSSSGTISFSSQCIRPLSLAGKVLGMIVIVPQGGKKPKKGLQELMSTISNILAMSLKNAQEYNRLKEMAVTDGLTGMYNQKGFGQFMKREFQRTRRYNKPLSLIMIDVDNFKSVNDSFGHQAGDRVLRELSGCLKRSVRQTDIVARYGGDEFAILLPETDMERAEMLVKRILHTIKHHAFEWRSERIKVEISHGVSTTLEIKKGQDEEELIHVADSRLYHMKRSSTLLRASSREVYETPSIPTCGQLTSFNP